MIKINRRHIANYFQHNDSWLFLVVFFTCAAINAVNNAPHNWGLYLSTLGLLLSAYLPLVIFVHFKKTIKESLPGWRYLPAWAGVFIVYSGLVAFIVETFFRDKFGFFESEFFVGLWFFLGFFDIAIEINRYWTHEKRLVNWLKKISLDRAILLVVAFFAVLFSMMTVSDLESLYVRDVIETNIRPLKIFNNFFLFISYSIQFFLIMATPYVFYWLNDRLLIPYLLKKRGALIYVAGVVGAIAVSFPILAQALVSLPLVQLAPSLMPSGTVEVFNEFNLTIPFVFMAFTLPVIVALQWFRQNHEIAQLEQQQVAQELNLLKQQINPHFFFNTLNNLYSLSLEKSDQSPEVILQLSELMRYVIYKGKEKEVWVEEELNYLKDYIQLQKIRLHKKLNLSFTEEVEEETLQIPPLLLIILVENAFKHGVEPAEGPSQLDISVKSDDRLLTFECVNSFEPPLSEKRGIGLDNLRRRLELHYPGRHRLTTTVQGTTFTANLAVWNE